MSQKVFTAWEDKHSQLWGNQPVCLSHSLSTSPLFSDETLGDLIDNYPRKHYSIVHVGDRDGARIWREGEIGDMSGSDVIKSIAAGRMWLNLRSIHLVDPRFAELVNTALGEVRERTGAPALRSINAGVLISSPRAQVYYHADLPGQSLWQIRGRKKVYVYPPTGPFLAPEQLEKIILTGVEVNLEYAPWYDEHAAVFDIGPGEMLHWPLNSPHRVDNHDCLNISLTTEYWTDDIRRNAMMNCGNAILRHKMGITPRSRSTSGPGFWAKAILQAGAKRSGLVKTGGAVARPIEFRLDHDRPGSIVDIPVPAR